jgi:GntR family transcriptional regulator of gluconate operon
MFVDDEAVAVPDDTNDLPVLAAITRPRKLAEEASELLRAQILSGKLRGGTHLVEAKLASRLGLSRGPVREALKMLIADGLVREQPRRGAFVVSLSRNDVREIYDVRAAVEGRAAYLLARDRQSESLSRLSVAVDGLTAAAAAHDMRAMRREDLAFHALICELSGNTRLLDIFNRYVPLVQALLSYDQLVYLSPEASAHEHRSIVDAIHGGDAVAAMREVVGHCERARDKLIVYFEEAPTE